MREREDVARPRCKKDTDMPLKMQAQAMASASQALDVSKSLTLFPLQDSSRR